MKKNRTKLTLFLLALILLINIKSFSQVVISESSVVTPDASAMLDIQSNSKGLLIPRLKTAERTGISNPAEGLLVYDSDLQSFFIYGKTAKGTVDWYNISDASGIWSRNKNNVYLSSTSYNVGIGTTTPSRKFVIQAKTDNDTLLLIQDVDGNPLLVITPKLTKFNFIEGAKGVSGGFAVGRYATAKGSKVYNDSALLVITPDSTRVYTSGSAVTSGGFAVGRYATAKGKKPYVKKYFFTGIDSTRVYTNGSGAKGVSGGFAVGRYATAKAGTGNYMYMIPDNYFIGDYSGEKLQSGKWSGKYNTFFGYQTGMNDTVGGSNVFIGYKSGLKNTGEVTGTNDSLGFRNVFLGYEAGYNNDKGSDNVLLGYKAGHEITTAGNNISIGSNAGFNNTNNSDNIFIGRQAGYNHVGTGTANQANNNIYVGLESGAGNGIDVNKGVNNVYVGNQSGKANTSGQDNVFLGNQSGLGNTSGVSNVFLGNKSGFSNAEGVKNVFLGDYAGYSNVGNGTLPAGSFNVFIGDSAGYDNTTGYTNMFIGPYAGAQNVAGYANIFIGTQAGMKNNNGNYNLFLGYNSGSELVDGTGNTFLGQNSGVYAKGGKKNIFIGPSSGENHLKGDNNIYLGEKAGATSETDPGDNHDNIFIGTSSGANNEYGNGNVFLGFEAGINNNGTSSNGVWGSQNVFLGYQSGHANTTGYTNVYIGYQAGFSNTTYSSNVFIGNSAGKMNEKGGNVFVGRGAGQNGVNGSSNTAVGYSSGVDTEGSGNTFLGFFSGNNTGSGTDNVYIGNSSGDKSVNGSGNVYIGNSAGSYGVAGTTTNPGSNNVYIGKSAGSRAQGNGNVFIGKESGFFETGSNLLYIAHSSTSTPLIWGDFANDSVKIFSHLNINNAYTFPDADGTADQVMVTDGSGAINWTDLDDSDWTVSTNDMYSAVSGNVGIGTNSPATKLDIAGCMRISGYNWPSSGAGVEIAYSSDVGYIQSYDRDGGGSRKPLSIIASKVGISTNTPNATLDVNGSVSMNIGSKTVSYTITDTDGVYTLLVSNTITITLPTAADNEGRILIFHKNSGNASTVTIKGEGTERINGSNTITLTNMDSSYTIQSTGSKWIINAEIN